MEDFITINGFKHYRHIAENVTKEESLKRSQEFLKKMSSRKSIRHFSKKPVPYTILENIIKSAASAPSGANKQPWFFALISNEALKRKIRLAAEEEEKLSYNGRMNEEWLQDLAHLGTDWEKPFLEDAPYLIVVFKKIYDVDNEGNKIQNYYVNESVGIACGFLISAIHYAGLVTLTHTPSPMSFLSKILQRPQNERPFLLLPVGYPAETVYVPNISKKPTSEILKHYE